jgi:hypothetical protein
MAASARLKSSDTGDEILKHKLFFGGNRTFDDEELKAALNEYGPVVDYIRHHERNCGYVTFYDSGVAQSLVGEVLVMEDDAEVELKFYKPQDNMRESDIEDIKKARAKYAKASVGVPKVIAKKVVSGVAGMKVPAAPKASVWNTPLIKQVPSGPSALSNAGAFPPLGSAAPTVAEANRVAPKKVQGSVVVPEKAPKAKKAVQPPQPALPLPIAKPVSLAPISAPAPSGLVGGTKVEVTVREDDVPKLVLTNSKFSISLLVCNGTNTSKQLENVVIDAPKFKNLISLESPLGNSDKFGQKGSSSSSSSSSSAAATLIGPQQSLPVHFSIASPSQPSAIIINFTFKLANSKSVRHKLLLTAVDDLPSVPSIAHSHYRPDHIQRRTIPYPSQFLDIRPIEHVPRFENEKAPYPLTPALIQRLEVAKMEPLTSPVWNDRANYKKRMHDLLWMEEMEQLRLLRAFDLPRTLMSEYGVSAPTNGPPSGPNAPIFYNQQIRDPLLSIDVPSLSERRPSIAPGDTLYAWVEGSKDVEYQGYIQSIRFGKAIVSFDPSFHKNVWAPHIFFTVRFSISRHAFLVEHMAIDDVDLDVIWPTNTPVPAALLQRSPLYQGLPTSSPAISYANAASSSASANSSVPPAAPTIPKIEVSKSSLSDPKIGENEMQIKAVNLGLNRLSDGAKNFPFLIFGPFGTGKTNTLVELIYQTFHTHPKAKLLVCALSNSAADLLATKLSRINAIGRSPMNLFRLYASTRAAEQHSSELQPYTYIDQNTGKFAIPPNIRQYRIVICTCANAAALKATISGHAIIPGEQVNVVDSSSSQENSSKSSTKQNSQNSQKNSQKSSKSSKTTTSSQSSASQMSKSKSQEEPIIGQDHFTHIFIDEAAQVMEADALIPLSLANRATSVVMAGDPKQLQYKSQSDAPALATLSLPIMERLLFLPEYSQIASAGAGNKSASGSAGVGVGQKPQQPNWVSLSDNYRSHPALLEFASNQFYHGGLRSKVDVASLGAKLGGWDLLKNPDFPMAYVPVEGVEQVEDDSPSFLNEHEARTIALLIQSLLSNFPELQPEEIGVITPFFKQTNRIRAMLRAVKLGGVTVSSIMNLQGREFKAIFVSTVRTSLKYLHADTVQGIGFIQNPSALNTVVTRSRALLVVVGDPYTVCQDPHWLAYIEACHENDTIIGSMLTPERIAERTLRDEESFKANPFLTSASDYRIDLQQLILSPNTTTIPSEEYHPSHALANAPGPSSSLPAPISPPNASHDLSLHPIPNAQSLFYPSAPSSSIDALGEASRGDAGSYLPFASDHLPPHVDPYSTTLSTLGNPILATATPPPHLHQNSAPLASESTSAVASSSLHRDAMEYQPSQRANGAAAGNASTQLGNSIGPSNSAGFQVILEMDGSPFLLTTPNFPAPQVAVANAENNTMEVQIATVGLQPHLELIPASGLCIVDPNLKSGTKQVSPASQVPTKAIIVSLAPIPPSHDTILWSNNAAQPQQIYVAIPVFAQHFECTRTPGWLKITLFRTSNITPPIASEAFSRISQ